jgi:protoporphyrinogen/coproporphyrinogen III oxidase
MQTVVIVGGGISGLTLAYRLQQEAPAVQVTLLEKENRLGGTLGTEHRDGFVVELGANGFLDSKPSTLALAHDLGLDDRLVPASEAAGRNRFVLLDGKLRALPAGLVSFLRSDVLSWRAKVNMAAEFFRPRRRGQRDESIAAFCRRRFGPQVAARLADPFVTGIYAGDPALLSVKACLPRLAALEAEHGSLLLGLIKSERQRRPEAHASGQPPNRGGQMWSFRGGLGILVDRLRDQLKPSPLASVSVHRITRRQEQGARSPRWVIEADGRDRWLADAVVLACPAFQQADMLADLDPLLAAQIAGIPYNRVAVVALGYRKEDVPASVDGFGFLVPQCARRNLLGVQWCSSIFPDRAPPGTVLLRAMCGGWRRAEMVDWNDDQLLCAVTAELRHVMGVRGNPIFQRIVRWSKAIPQYMVGHLDRVAWIQQRASGHPSLFLAGNAYGGVALNDCVERGSVLARRVAQFLITTAGH